MTAQEIVDADTAGDDNNSDGGLAVNVRVLVHPDTDEEARGVVVDLRPE